MSQPHASAQAASGARSVRAKRWLLLLMLVLQMAFLWVRSWPLLPHAGEAMALAAFLSGACATAVLALPATWWTRLVDWARARTATDRARQVALVLLGFLVLATAALVQQRWSWDERVLWRSASALADGGLEAFFARYREERWLASQHPPFLLLLYGFAMSWLGEHLLVLRGIDALFAIATLLLAYRLLVQLGGESGTAFRAALLLLASPLFVRMGSAATLDMPFTCFFVLSLVWAVRLGRARGNALALPLGLAIGLGLVSKYLMVLVYPLVLVLMLREGRFALQAKRMAIVVAVSLIPLALWLAYADQLGLLEGQVTRLTRLSGTVTRSAASRGWAYDAVLTKLPSALGIYTMPLLLLGAYRGFRRRSSYDRALLVWIVLICVPLLLTLPDNRYFLPAFPAFAAISARALEQRRGVNAPVLALALSLCAVTILYYAQIDLSRPVFLFRAW